MVDSNWPIDEPHTDLSAAAAQRHERSEPNELQRGRSGGARRVDQAFTQRAA
jgi:hypothetical protein